MARANPRVVAVPLPARRVRKTSQSRPRVALPSPQASRFSPGLVLIAVRGPEAMGPEIPCFLCCSSCTSGQGVTPSQHDATSGSFAVRNLLPAGTLSLPISQTDLRNICVHSHTAEGWHNFLGKSLLPQITDQENETLCRHLDFLVEHKFLVVQCKVGDSRTALVLRVYIVPYDLPGVQGKLRVRDEATELRPARVCLRNVLPRVIQDKSVWDSHDLGPLPSAPRYLLDSDTVVVFSISILSRNLLASRSRITVP
jgi:hypothetical protein